MPGFPRTNQSQPCCDWFVLLNGSYLGEKCLDFPERISRNMCCDWFVLLNRSFLGEKCLDFPERISRNMAATDAFCKTGAFWEKNAWISQNESVATMLRLIRSEQNGRFLREKTAWISQNESVATVLRLIRSAKREPFERKMPGFPRTNQLQPCCDWFILLNGRFLGEEVPGFPRTTQSQPCCDWFVLLNGSFLREKCLDFPERISRNIATNSFC